MVKLSELIHKSKSVIILKNDSMFLHALQYDIAIHKHVILLLCWRRVYFREGLFSLLPSSFNQ